MILVSQQASAHNHSRYTCTLASITNILHNMCLCSGLISPCGFQLHFACRHVPPCTCFRCVSKRLALAPAFGDSMLVDVASERASQDLNTYSFICHIYRSSANTDRLYMIPKLPQKHNYRKTTKCSMLFCYIQRGDIKLNITLATATSEQHTSKSGTPKTGIPRDN